jgi:hypothetical protein
VSHSHSLQQYYTPIFHRELSVSVSDCKLCYKTLSTRTLYKLNCYRAEQSKAVAYCWQPASTVTLGIEPRWDPWPYICSVSRLLFFFSFVVPPLIKGRGWAFFVIGVAAMVSRITPQHRRHRKLSPYCCVIHGNVFIWPLPRNGFRNTAVLLSRNLATDCLPSISLPSNEL